MNTDEASAGAPPVHRPGRNRGVLESTEGRHFDRSEMCPLPHDLLPALVSVSRLLVRRGSPGSGIWRRNGLRARHDLSRRPDGLRPPYTLALVDLDEGIRLLTEVVGDVEPLIGCHVELAIEVIDGSPLHKFQVVVW